MEKRVSLLQTGQKIMEGHQADVREKIEELLYDKLCISVYLQESAEEGEYQIYMHTDSYEDLEEDEIDKLNSLGITDYGESTTKAIYQLLDIQCNIIGDWRI